MLDQFFLKYKGVWGGDGGGGGVNYRMMKNIF